MQKVIRIVSLIFLTFSLFLAPIFVIVFVMKPDQQGGIFAGISVLVLALSIYGFRKTKPVGVPLDPNLNREYNEFLSTLNRNHAYPAFILIGVFTAVQATLIAMGKISLDATPAELYQVGGGYGHDTLHGQFWRLITPLFLHGDLGHLASNAIGLWAAGRLLDYLVGWKNFFAIYFLGGIAGALASAMYNPGIVSIGASGAIFAVYGALLAGLAFDPNLKNLKAPRSVFIGAGIQAFNSLAAGFRHSNIDNAAHFGGLIAGFIILAAWYLIKNQSYRRIIPYSATAAVLAVVSFAVGPQVVAKSTTNPVAREKTQDAAISAIGSIEKWEKDFSVKIQGEETPENKLAWVRDQLVPGYRSDVDLLKKSLEDEAIKSNEKLLMIGKLVADSATQCIPFFEYMGNPPEVETEETDANADKVANICVQAIQARSDKITELSEKK